MFSGAEFTCILLWGKLYVVGLFLGFFFPLRTVSSPNYFHSGLYILPIRKNEDFFFPVGGRNKDKQAGCCNCCCCSETNQRVSSWILGPVDTVFLVWLDLTIAKFLVLLLKQMPRGKLLPVEGKFVPWLSERPLSEKKNPVCNFYLTASISWIVGNLSVKIHEDFIRVVS